jgi:hypothetical protein
VGATLKIPPTFLILIVNKQLKSRENMKNLKPLTTENLGTNPETTEKKELSNRQIQFDRLIKASQQARELKEQLMKAAPNAQAALTIECKPLNFYLLHYVYKTNGITDFKKFNEWKQQGATVKKGEKAFPIWGQPVGKQKEEEAQSKGENYTASQEENERFPMCYVFSNLQVRAAERKEAVC